MMAQWESIVKYCDGNSIFCTIKTLKALDAYLYTD